MTPPDAATWLEVRQNSARMFRTAEKVALPFPKRLSMTSGIVTAMVLRMRGAKYARGIIAIDAARTYQMALMPQSSKAFCASPVVDPPPMLLADREKATMKMPILLPATM